MDKKRLGRPKGPDALRRVNLVCRVLPETLKALGGHGERGKAVDEAVKAWIDRELIVIPEEDTE